MMPELDGPEVLARLRADKRTAVIPVIFVTAHACTAQRAQLASLGAAGVIAKPIDTGEFAREVRRHVALEGVLAAKRDEFLRRLDADACALTACRPWLSHNTAKAALLRINEIAHALAGAGGIYGFAGISSELAALSDAAEDNLAGHAKRADLEQALDRLLKRIRPNQAVCA